ncbi:PVC-type heme-binding CxxCH protein [Sphingobacterium rhinopitheci]|uniref:PVC-type heme-binding CxxCH protein n=1 Tax=Sphingobacterium rhinopitheci TaxID=2781960 RepID=UPI001F52622C|nr:PVC-type heme-binding CxxCH protein [Sphingobacterium rhinopitheci]MCI0920922.1 ThuA domain-containing protein [Sphingobacterium rhinopitheci]
MKNLLKLFFLVIVFLTSSASNIPRRAEVLFIGAGNEKASNHATWLSIELFKSGINTTYSNDLSALQYDNLNKYDAVVLLTKEAVLAEEYENSLKRFLQNGKGVVALYSAANSFGNSAWYKDLVNGGFVEAGNGDVNVVISDKDKILNFPEASFPVKNENFSFNIQSPGVRVFANAVVNGKSQPYGWTKDQGAGRFVYIALGKNDQTWKNRDFLNLVHKGVWWSLASQTQADVKDLAIPNVSIYPDSIADFTARYDVPRMQDPLSPVESMKLIQNPQDFELKLFVSEPNIRNPLAMSWDERGRLWVIESIDYPNNFEKERGKGNDRIKICEDTDGDGVADKFTIFKDGLNIATSLTFANDGVIVAMAPDFMFFKDTNGDDVADVEEIIMTGWSKGDTHAGPSNLQYGFDNKIWGVTGYAGYNGTVDGKRHIFGQGLYRLKPDGTDFEYLATTSNNTWGLGMTEDNNVFISTANNTHSAFYSMPEKLLQRSLKTIPDGSKINSVQNIDGHYEVHALTPNLRQVDVVGGFTSAAGHQMYTARDYPKDYWNSMAFITEPTVRLVHNAKIEKNGAGFKEHDGWNLLASSDEWFGPIHAEVGPDGAVWILDWYNFIIQHNVFVPAQAPSEKVLPFTEQVRGDGNAFESDLRDKKYGRVYRLLYKDGKHNESYKLSKDNPQELIKALNSTNKFWRMHAQRLLVERKNQDVQADLIAIVNDKYVDEIGLNAPAIHAIWTLDGLGLLKNKEVNDAVVAALNHPSAGVRKAAIQVLDLNPKSFLAISKSNIFADKDLNTRLAAFVKVAESEPFKEIAPVLKKAIDDPVNAKDKWLAAGLYAAIQNNQSAVRPTLMATSKNSFEKNILESLRTEEYKLGRRSRLQFSPDVANKDIDIKTEISRRDQDQYKGLIVGQGVGRDGYALYMQGNKLIWEIIQNGVGYSISSSAGISDEFEVNASLSQANGARLYINNNLVGQIENVKPFKKSLAAYLRSGNDLNDSLSLTQYVNGSEFIGNVSEINVKLQPLETNTHHQHNHQHMHTAGVTTKTNVTANKAPATTQSTAKAPVTTKTATKAPASQVIVIKAVKDLMQYDKRTITVKAGQQVTLIMENPDAMPHNLVLIKPGTTEIVGKAADAMLQSSNAAQRHYVPQVPEVLFFTKLVNPGESYTLKFQAPKVKGNYPYICTFPGHWRGMTGVMKVVD